MPANWLIYALLSAAFAALVAIFGKIGLAGVDTTLATTIRAAVMFLFLLIIAFSLGKFGGSTAFTGKTWLFIVLSGVAGALSWLCYFLALKHGTAAKVAPIDRLSVVFVIVLAALFLGEKIGFKTGVGAALITAGAVLIAL